MDRELNNSINVIPLVLLVIALTTATFVTTGPVPVESAKVS